jgi:hypothetical protein
MPAAVNRRFKILAAITRRFTMKIRTLSLIALAVFLTVSIARADAPRIIHFQGVLTDDLGDVLEGTYSVTFSLYNVESGGTALWSEINDVDCENGLFSIILGLSTTLDLEFSEQYWIGYQVAGDTEMTPRSRLASVPYAMYTAVADSAHAAAIASVASSIDWDDIYDMPLGFADGVDDTGSFAPHDHDDRYYTETELSTPGTVNDGSNPVDWTKLKGVPSGFADGIDNVGGGGGWVDDGTYVRLETSTDKVGIGTSSPSFALDVAGAIGTDGYIYHNDDHDTYLLFGEDRMNLWAGGSKMVTVFENTQDEVVINDDGNDTDFRVESDVNDRSLFVEGGTGMVGFGTLTPSQQVDVNGTVQTLGFRMPTGAADGHVLTSNASGVASWAAPSGGLPAGTIGQTLRRNEKGWVANSVIYNNGTNVGIGTSSPTSKLEVSGDIEVQDENWIGIGSVNERIVFDSDGDDIELMGGLVGIMIANPSYALDVGGNAGFNEHLYHNDDSDTYLKFEDDKIRLYTGGMEMVTLSESPSTDEIAVNEGQLDVDFRVESDTDKYALFVRASDSKVGINNASPNYELDVDGDIGVNEYVYHNGDSDTYTKFETDAFVLYTGGLPYLYAFEGITMQDVLYVNDGNNDIDFVVQTDNSDYTLYVEGSDDEVGIGTNTPSHKLHVEATSNYAMRAENTSSGTYSQLAGSTLGANIKGSNDGTGTSGLHVHAQNNFTSPSAKYGVYVYMTAEGDGSGYESAVASIGVRSPYGLSATDDNYHFAVWGELRETTPERAGGVIGVADADEWGCLAYKSSSGVLYGGYFDGGYVGGSGKNGVARQSVGFGSYGELLGGWARGDIYGFYSAGERYASYTDGNSFTNGYQATLHDVGGAERVATFTPTSMKVDVYDHGVGRLVNGKAEIAFDQGFLDLISNDADVTVSVTAVGAPAGLLYITKQSSRSFEVELMEIPGLKAGNQNISFNWIAIGLRRGYEVAPEIPEELVEPDFDANMQAFAFNEGNMEGEGKPMWFDGVSIRWDTPPQRPMSAEKLAGLELERLELEAQEAEEERVREERRRAQEELTGVEE